MARHALLPPSAVKSAIFARIFTVNPAKHRNKTFYALEVGEFAFLPPFIEQDLGLKIFSTIEYGRYHPFRPHYVIPNDDVYMRKRKQNKVPHQKVMYETRLLLGAEKSKPQPLNCEIFRINEIKTGEYLSKCKEKGKR